MKESFSHTEYPCNSWSLFKVTLHISVFHHQDFLSFLFFPNQVHPLPALVSCHPGHALFLDHLKHNYWDAANWVLRFITSILCDAVSTFYIWQRGKLAKTAARLIVQDQQYIHIHTNHKMTTPHTLSFSSGWIIQIYQLSSTFPKCSIH